jgi:hypothetical protein
MFDREELKYLRMGISSFIRILENNLKMVKEDLSYFRQSQPDSIELIQNLQNSIAKDREKIISVKQLQEKIIKLL